jgi:hypothetical protein
MNELFLYRRAISKQNYSPNFTYGIMNICIMHKYVNAFDRVCLGGGGYAEKFIR